MLSRFGEVEVNITEEVKSVCYLLTENGKNLERFSDLTLKEFKIRWISTLTAFRKSIARTNSHLKMLK